MVDKKIEVILLPLIHMFECLAPKNVFLIIPNKECVLINGLTFLIIMEPIFKKSSNNY